MCPVRPQKFLRKLQRFIDIFLVCIPAANIIFYWFVIFLLGLLAWTCIHNNSNYAHTLQGSLSGLISHPLSSGHCRPTVSEWTSTISVWVGSRPVSFSSTYECRTYGVNHIVKQGTWIHAIEGIGICACKWSNDMPQYSITGHICLIWSGWIYNHTCILEKRAEKDIRSLQLTSVSDNCQLAIVSATQNKHKMPQWLWHDDALKLGYTQTSPVHYTLASPIWSCDHKHWVLTLK